MRDMFSIPGFQSHSREARVYVYNLTGLFVIILVGYAVIISGIHV